MSVRQSAALLATLIGTVMSSAADADQPKLRVALTAPVNGTVLTAPAAIALAATVTVRRESDRSERDKRERDDDAQRKRFEGGDERERRGHERDKTDDPGNPHERIVRVEFYQGGTRIGTATAAPYAATWSDVAPGVYALSALAVNAKGESVRSAPVTVTVNAPPVVSLTSPAGGERYNAPANVTLTASASDPDGAVAQVEFFQGATPVGVATAAPYRVVLPAMGAGVYTFTARATDDRGAVTTSAPLAVRINALPSVSLTAPAPHAVVNAPGSFTLTADATDADGTIAKVEFYANGSLIGGSTHAPYGVPWSSVPAGRYSLTAVATDSDGAVTASAAVPVRVNGYPSVSLTSPTANAAFKAPGPVTLTATAADTDGGISRVEFYAGTVLVGTVSAPPYTYLWAQVTPGSYVLTARAVDDNGAGAVSAPVAITVASPEAQVYYIHTDHLNTPRAITNAQRELVWIWPNDDPFGNNPANEDPRNTGTPFTCNLRFPGQYFDRETNLHYNYFRDYDPQTGRYIESDPIGLMGGIGLYSYANGNPLRFMDTDGQAFCWASYSSGRLICVSDFPSAGDPIAINIRIASGNNADNILCKNNSACESRPNRGPLPRGLWQFGAQGSSGKPDGRRLTPILGTNNYSRSLFASHSCLNAFGPSLNPPFCSEGCLTGSVTDIRRLNRLIDNEPRSWLLVTE